MRLWREHRQLRECDCGSPSVIGLRDVLDEALRGTRNEREFDVVPIFSDGVIDDSPPLEQRLLLSI